MIEATVLNLLLGVMVAVGALLVLVAAAAVGRTLADLEYQIEAGIGGGPRIQTWVKLRSNANRVGLGLAFVTVAIMSLVNLPGLWQQWLARGLFIGVLITFAISAVLDWLAERRSVRLAMAAAEETSASTRLAADTERRSYQEIANEAVSRLETSAAAARVARGEPPMPPMASVVPEHNSPITSAQQATADLATMRARLTAAALDLGQVPRVPVPPENPESAS